ncbi:MAG: hypothetical protein VXZ82_14395 [Planctomycetota bacterium]|nr:hypothetical protein [Planctomycetota bacterium]
MAEVFADSVRFSGEELDLAQLFKAYGLDWTPEVGHYVLDQSELIECESPFQDRVFFILDLKHFLRRSETIENLKERVCWLPTWEQMRQLLREHDVSDQTVVEHLELTQAIGRGTERLELYRLFEERLTGGLM